MLSPFNLPEGIILLITDELSSPSDFLLHRSLISHLKESKGAKNIVLSVSAELTRWKAITSKSNVNLTEQISSGSMQFIDVPSCIQPTPHGTGSEKASLRPLFELINSGLDNKLQESNKSPPLVIVDDVTTLEWIGFSMLDICRFTRALRAKCLQAGATLIIRHHTVTPNDPDDLFRHLLQLCSYHLEVRPLSSGRSGSVSGEIALHSGPSTLLDPVKLIPRGAAKLYRLTDAGPIFFERGTGGGVL